MDMRENHLSYRETVRKYRLGDPNIGGTRQMIQRWERIFLEEGAARTYGRTSRKEKHGQTRETAFG